MRKKEGRKGVSEGEKKKDQCHVSHEKREFSHR